MILLDIDGVLADFAYAICKKTGIPFPPINYAMYKGYCSKETFYEAMANEAFWAELPLYSHAKALVDLFVEPVLCTKPVSGPHRLKCLKGKAIWANKHFPDHALAFMHDKSMLAKPGTLLIDDNESNVAKFRAAGGDIILFPQPYNSLAKYSEEAFDYAFNRAANLGYV